jgi:hypothetical protein
LAYWLFALKFFCKLQENVYNFFLRRNQNIRPTKTKIQGDSKLLSGFKWPIIFKPKQDNKTADEK